jgi:acyl-CoA synthetase (NDP forming)
MAIVTLPAAQVPSAIPLKYGKPLLTTSMRTTMQGVAYDILRERNISFYEFPEACARAMYGLVAYSRIVRKFS